MATTVLLFSNIGLGSCRGRKHRMMLSNERQGRQWFEFANWKTMMDLSSMQLGPFTSIYQL
jgi:hypothetical protein